MIKLTSPNDNPIHVNPLNITHIEDFDGHTDVYVTSREVVRVVESQEEIVELCDPYLVCSTAIESVLRVPEEYKGPAPDPPKDLSPPHEFKPNPFKSEKPAT